MFASDINDAALAVARSGIYPLNIAADVNDARLMSFFEKEEGVHYRVRTAIREMIVFAAHNVLGDPPFSRLDLICCRNLLIYLDRAAQTAVLEILAYALKPGGYLMLGNAESIDAAGTPFRTVSKEHRIYKLRPASEAGVRTRIPSHLVSLSPAPAHATPPPSAQAGFQTSQQRPLLDLHEQAILAAALPNVLINASHEIERVSPGAGRFVTFGEGIPTRNLLSNIAPDIRVELRAALFRASEANERIRTVFRRGDQSAPPNGPAMALTVCPVKGADGEPAHWLVLFDEPVDYVAPPAEGSRDHAAYDAAMQRLEDENRALKAHLQETLDRSAISNEELKASNEELQAINEELRSAKEELETSKEEIQSVNEELTTVNFELRMKVDEATRNNDDLRNLIEASDIATVFVDPGMRVKRFTPEASKLFALIPTDVGRPLMDVKSRLQYDEIIDDATAVFKDLQPVERSVTSRDGEHFLARVRPYRTSLDKIGGAVLTFINVTELRRAESQMRSTEERLRNAIATSKDFAVICTDSDAKITTWNDGAARIFGYSATQIVGQPIDVLFTADDRARGAPEQERLAAIRDGRAADERWHLRRDGTTFFCSGVMTQLLSPGGGFLKIARDASDRRNREQQQQDELNTERREATESKQAVELKDRFLAVMSHELKQPLNLIQVNAQLLVRLPEVKDVPAVQRIGATIGKAVLAQEKIVNDLLDLSRAKTGKLRLNLEPADLVEIVQRLSQAMVPDFERKQLTMALTAPKTLVCICDRVRIEQVIWNLLGNAVKFTPAGGRVALALSLDDGQARVDVSDTGIGIAPEFLPRVFELFSQAEISSSERPGRAGLGIGLALVRELVLGHGGRIEARSEGVGKGTAFTLWIPATVPAQTSAEEHPSANGLKRRILIVDDDADSLMAFSALLEMEGATVDTAGSGAEALKYLAEEKYDILLSDIGMPEMTGLELIERARKLVSQTSMKSIAITGYGRESDAREALNAGFDAHVSKPISLERLTAALQSLDL